MKRPILTLPEAVSTYVQPGSCVYLGNFGSQLYAVGYEIIRQRLTELHLVLSSGGLLLDQLFGAGVASSATFGHCWSPVGPNPAWNFRRLAEGGNRAVTLHEMSLGMMNAALTAGAWNVPFMPFPGLTTTGYVEENWSSGAVTEAVTEFGNHLVVKAITPDVAFIHVDQCDEFGNGKILGPTAEVMTAMGAAQHVVLVAEELVDTSTLTESGFNIPGFFVSAIVERPGAVAPDGAVGRYDRDLEAYAAYTDASQTEEGFERWVTAVRDTAEGEQS